MPRACGGARRLTPGHGHAPASALSGVLVVVCWNMAEKEESLHLLHDRRGASVLLATFGLTLIENLTAGIIAGCVLAAVSRFSTSLQVLGASPVEARPPG
jgi:MFS superfamily sulfate permease-like transporter